MLLREFSSLPIIVPFCMGLMLVGFPTMNAQEPEEHAPTTEDDGKSTQPPPLSSLRGQTAAGAIEPRAHREQNHSVLGPVLDLLGHLELKDDAQEPLHASIWDFGGQEVRFLSLLAQRQLLSSCNSKLNPTIRRFFIQPTFCSFTQRASFWSSSP